MAKKIKALDNIAEAILETTKQALVSIADPLTPSTPLARDADKWGKLLKPRGPAIPERKPSEAEARRLVAFKDGVLMRTLAYALSMKRPHAGVGERNLLGYILLNRPAGSRWTFDTAGNLHIDLCAEPTQRTLFVAHVDTVHAKDGYNKIRMTESVWYAHGSQLGADDGAGVAMLMHLMTEGVPGHYVFTLGEECGGIGSTALAKDQPQLLKRFDRAIAFDRRGTTSVISHQGMGRCCSDAFAEALSAALTTDELMYMPDDTGVYTDTAEFVDLVPECTNISVGYEREHSDEEAQDILHLQALAEQCVRLAWDELPVVRDPREVDDLYSYGYGSYGTRPTRDDYDFKMFLDDEEIDAYDRLLDAAEGGKVGPLAVHVAAAVSDWYPELPSEALLRMATTACNNIGERGLRLFCGDIEAGDDVSTVLQSLYEEGQRI